MRRVLAVLAAVGLVALAFAVRDRDDDGDGASAAPAGPVVCADDLAGLCRAAGLDVVEQVAGGTADALLAEDGELGGRAWVTTSAWARLVVDERDRLGFEPTVEVAGDAIGHTAVQVAVWEEAADELRDRCPGGGRIGWRCLAEQAGTVLADGTRVRAAVPPVDSATGLVHAAAQAADLLGTSTYASNDFELGDFRLLQPRLAERQARAPFATMRSRGPGELTAAAVTLAEATSTGSTFGPISTLPLAVEVQASVVVVVPIGAGVPDGLPEDLSAALAAAGWSAGPPPTGRDLLPGGSVLAALRTLWSDAG